MIAVPGTRSWKTFSALSDPSQLLGPVTSFLIFGLSCSSSYMTTMWVLVSYASPHFKILFSVELLLQLLSNATLHFKLEAELAGEMEIDTSL